MPVFFFFNDTATTEIYTLSLHVALPISSAGFPRLSVRRSCCISRGCRSARSRRSRRRARAMRSEEHTSELQSRSDLVCRLLLEKKNDKTLQRDVPQRCMRFKPDTERKSG